MIPGDRLSLWALERHDILTVYKWVNDPDVISTAIQWHFPLSLEDVENWFIGVSSNPGVKVFSIRTNDGNFIGMIELNNIDWKNRKADLGIILGEKEYWGKGYGEEAMRLLVDFAFKQLNLHRLGASVLEVNDRSLGLFKKLGFKEEGRLRDAIFQDGKYHTLILLSLLRDEWSEQS